MNPLIVLLLRIAHGEKYRKTERKDAVIWLSFFAAFPIIVTCFYVASHSIMASAPLGIIWLIGCAEKVCGLLAWSALSRLGLLAATAVLAVVGWACLYFVVYRSLRKSPTIEIYVHPDDFAIGRKIVDDWRNAVGGVSP